jgi:hypothetical protein
MIRSELFKFNTILQGNYLHYPFRIAPACISTFYNCQKNHGNNICFFNRLSG